MKTSEKEENLKETREKKTHHIQENKNEIYYRIFVRSSISQKLKE